MDPKRVRIGAVIGVLALLLLLLVRSCVDSVEAEQLFVPRDLAAREELDGAEAIVEYVRREIRPAAYEGIFRGAHGALWAGEANDWDRALLALEIFEGAGIEALIVPGKRPRVAYETERWRTVDFESDATPEPSDAPPVGAVTLAALAEAQPSLFHDFELELRLHSAGGEPVREHATGRLADLVHQPLLLAVEEDGDGLRYVLRAGDETLLTSVVLTAVTSAELRFTWTFGDGKVTWQRQLFSHENTGAESPGHAGVRASDRYAIVISAGPLRAEVLETREKMMTSVHHTPVADPLDRELVLLGTKYQVDTDLYATELTEKLDVLVDWRTPRITIAASERVSDEEPLSEDGRVPGASLDALADRVDAQGRDQRAFHLSRGKMNDLIEARALYGAVREPVVCASTVFAHLRSEAPETPRRRLNLIGTEAERLMSEELLGTRVRLEGRPPQWARGGASEPAGIPHSLEIELVESGLRLHGAKEISTGVRDGAPGYEWGAASSYVDFGGDAIGLALTADGLLARQVGASNYHLASELSRSSEMGALPIVPGSQLIYRLRDGEEERRLVVLVSFDAGRPGGRWIDLDAEGSDLQPLTPSSPEVLEVVSGRPMLRTYTANVRALPGDAVQYKLTVGASERTVSATRVSTPILREEPEVDESERVHLTVLEDPTFPLVLAWSKGNLSLRLESVSPVLRGRVLDERSRAAVWDSASASGGALPPVSHARVSLVSRSKSTLAAIDGSFALPVTRPLFRRVVLLLDRSGSMLAALDERERRPPPEKQRITMVRRAARELVEQMPPDVEMVVWPFVSNVSRVTEFTRDRSVLITALEEKYKRYKREYGAGGTLIASSVEDALEILDADERSRDAIILLLTDGESTEDRFAPDVYEASNSSVEIHTVGFAIVPDSKAERELRLLAETSGGTYRLAGQEEDLREVFRQFGEKMGDLRLWVTSPAHLLYERPIEYATAATRFHEVRLIADENAGGDAVRLLEIGVDNVADLEYARGLSSRARRMIEERVADGAWTVTIPTRRANIAGVTAYAWYETERATWRTVGRTEDGLHGSVGVSGRWPPFMSQAGDLAAGTLGDSRFAGRAKVHPYAAWVAGLSAYAGGSFRAMASWHRSPGFSSGSVDDLKEFVQANALGYVVELWPDIAALIGSEQEASFWSGVCFSHQEQRRALGLPPSGQCASRWLRDLCERYLRSQLSLPGVETGDVVTQAAVDRLREEVERLLRQAIANGDSSLAQDIRDALDKLDEGIVTLCAAATRRPR